MNKPMLNLSIRQLQRNFPHLSRLIQRFPVQNISRSLGAFTTESDPSLAPRIRWQMIPSGPQGTRETLKVMAALAHEAASNPAFVHTVIDVAEVPGSLDLIDQWIRQRFRRRDESEEVVREPAAM